MRKNTLITISLIIVSLGAGGLITFFILPSAIAPQNAPLQSQEAGNSNQKSVETLSPQPEFAQPQESRAPTTSKTIDRDKPSRPKDNPTPAPTTYPLTSPVAVYNLNEGKKFYVYDVTLNASEASPQKLIVPKNSRIQIVFGNNQTSFEVGSQALNFELPLAQKGEKRSVTFDSTQSGIFPYSCSCDSNNVNGEVIVQ